MTVDEGREATLRGRLVEAVRTSLGLATPRVKSVI